MLDAAGGVRLKPGIRVNFFTFDRDETAPGIGRNNADRDIVARVVLFAVELDLELGVFFQRACSYSLTNDRKMQLAQGAVLIIAQLEDVIARLLRWERVMQSPSRNRDLFRFGGTLAQDRFVDVISVL